MISDAAYSAQKNWRLLVFLTRAEIGRRYAGSIGGAIYSFLSPLLLVGAMYLALHYGLNMRALSGENFGLKVAVCMLLWQAFTASVQDSALSIVQNPHLVKKVVFPVHFLPLSSLLGAFYIHVVLITLVVISLAVFGTVLWPGLWMLLPGFAITLSCAVGLSFLVASLNVFVRDTQVITQFVLTTAFWLSPIIWSADRLPESARWLLAFNPMATPIALYEAAMTGAPFEMGIISVASNLFINIVLIVVGVSSFHVLRTSFADKL